MKKIVYIGNGFDLAHDLKTSYKDFVDNKKYDKMDDTDNSFKLISEYASLNGGSLEKDNHDYSDVEEIVIMGHGLNSDKRYFADVFEKCVKLKKIVYYTRIKDNGEINNVDKQIEFLKHISGLNEVEIKTYSKI